jgi:phospholipid/cholesterol/gamma-HCH transport system ATP-binding protein
MSDTTQTDVFADQTLEAQAGSITQPGEAAAGQNAIVVRDLKKSFAGRLVLKGLNLEVARGSVCVILGGSGMGKSVLMKHLIGLLKPDSGEVIIDGQDITKLGALELKKVRGKYGMVFQQAALFDSMSNYDNVAFPLREHTKLSRQAVDEKVRALMELFSLDPDELGPRFPSEISGGQRKRVGLARAVALDPQIVLYDEPTTGLDPITTDQVDDMILQAKRKLGITSVVISHDIASAFHIADQILFIFEGEIVVRGKQAEMLACEHPFVQKFFETWQAKNA